MIFTFHTCHLFLFPLTILCVTLHFLSQDGFPATVSFLTVKPVQTNKKKREGKKKKTWLDEKQTNKNYCNSIEKGISASVFPLAVSRWALKGSLSVTCQRKHNCTFCSWSIRDKNSTWNAVLVGDLEAHFRCYFSEIFFWCLQNLTPADCKYVGLLPEHPLYCSTLFSPSPHWLALPPSLLDCNLTTSFKTQDFFLPPPREEVSCGITLFCERRGMWKLSYLLHFLAD